MNQSTVTKWVDRVAVGLFFGGTAALVSCMMALIVIEVIDSPSDGAWAGIVCSLISMAVGFTVAYRTKT